MVDIWWHGQACIRIKGKNAAVVLDPFKGNAVGLAEPKLTADIICVTHDHPDNNNTQSVLAGEDGKPPFVISGPGEYEISDVTVVGVPSFHDDNNGQDRGKNTIYLVTIDEVNFVHLGDLGQKKLTKEQVEELSMCDVLFIPVGSVFTISGDDAPDIISQLEPKIIVPIHYKVEGLKFELDGVDKFLHAMGKEKLELQPKLSVASDRLPEEPEVVVLEKQK